MDTTTFDAHGVTFTVSSSDADVVDALDDLLVDLVADPHAGRRPVRYVVEAIVPDDDGGTGTSDGQLDDQLDGHLDLDLDRDLDDQRRWFRVTADDDVVYAALHDGSLVSHLLMDVNARAAAACRRAGAVPLHAGSVAGVDGDGAGAIVLPGASHSGKTTLTTALAVAGHRFLADEVSRLDPQRLTIAPYGKPVALRPASVELLAPSIARLRRAGSRFEADERFVPPSELGLADADGTASPTAGISAAPVAAADPVEVTAVVFPRYDPEGPDRFTPLSPAETLERLMQCTLGTAATTIGVDVFRALERLVRSAPGHDLTYTDLPVAVDALASLTTLR